MFVDQARLLVTAGKGGKGCCSFRREKYVPRGGPNGGDGGHGGDVVLIAEERLTSLLDVQYHSNLRGKNGEHGQGSNCHGANGEETCFGVPAGTVIRDFHTGEIVADLTEPGQRFVAARGGRGGKGNARFATSTNRAPRFAELGEPGEQAEYLLELKIIAEVGLVGLPNAGKSTLLAAVSAATPKIADYPFTTLTPNLGVAALSDYRHITFADIPGIIEGAAEGKGLGHDFLRHIERTRILLFLIDLGDDDPLATYRVLDAELAQHSAVFAQRRRVIAFNKADLTGNRDRFESVRSDFNPAFLISGATGEGVPELLEHLWAMLDRIRREEPEPVSDESERTYSFEAPFTIAVENDGFRIEGNTVVRAARMTDFENDEAVQHFQSRLQRLGVFKALKRQGAQEGQPIYIDTIELEYHPD